MNATDRDTGDELTYVLVSDTNLFTIESTPTGGQLKTSGVLDFEGEDEYTVEVTVTDNKAVNAQGELMVNDEGEAIPDPTVDDTIEVTINVMDVNEKPTFANFTGPGSSATNPADIAENNTGAEVTTVTLPTVTDPDTGNSDFNALTYSLSGDDASFFTIVPSGDDAGQLSTGAAGLNHEADRDGDGDIDADDYDYMVTVGVSDGKDAEGNNDPTADDTIEVTIRVTNVNEKPVFVEQNPVREVSEDTDARVRDIHFDDPVLARDPDLMPDSGINPPTYGSEADTSIEGRPLTYTVPRGFDIWH